MQLSKSTRKQAFYLLCIFEFSQLFLLLKYEIGMIELSLELLFPMLKSGLGRRKSRCKFFYFHDNMFLGKSIVHYCYYSGVVHCCIIQNFETLLNEIVLSIAIVSYWPVPFVLASRWYNYSTLPIHLENPTRDISRLPFTVTQPTLTSLFNSFHVKHNSFYPNQTSINFAYSINLHSWYITYSFLIFSTQTQNVA